MSMPNIRLDSLYRLKLAVNGQVLTGEVRRILGVEVKILGMLKQL
jgi:hypothetical protein